MAEKERKSKYKLNKQKCLQYFYFFNCYINSKYSSINTWCQVKYSKLKKMSEVALIYLPVCLLLHNCIYFSPIKPVSFLSGILLHLRT